MPSKTVTMKNLYFDSVSLMRISGEASALPGISEALVGMGTDLNKELLQGMGLGDSTVENALPSDLLIGLVGETEAALEAALEEVRKILERKGKPGEKGGTGTRKFASIKQVAELEEGYNLAVVSVPGIYAARECRNALESGMHVFLFSDNVSVEEEVALKDLALQKELLMMGPDCGTAIVGGVPLGFANRVRRGDIGVVAASGTGLQHVTTLIDHLGGGISQAIGTGGRDLSEKVGGRTMIAALRALQDDPGTKVVVILSKPPSPAVADKVLAVAKSMTKPVVLCLFGKEKMDDLGPVVQCFDIERTAVKAVSLSSGKELSFKNGHLDEAAARASAAARLPKQKYVRGIFGGGTLCDEAMITFRRAGIPFRSNIPLAESERLSDTGRSEGNTFIDMGDDDFTRGKPHPMIDPSLRNKRIVRDAALPDTLALLLDFVLGPGSHPDPAGVALEAVAEARAAMKGRDVVWLASVVGTEADPQNYREQIDKLKAAGFIVSESNVALASLAASLVGERRN